MLSSVILHYIVSLTKTKRKADLIIASENIKVENIRIFRSHLANLLLEMRIQKSNELLKVKAC